MKMLPRCSVIAAVILASGLTLVLPKNRPSDKYQALVARLKQGDITVDFREVRRAYADSPEYTDATDSDEVKAMYDAYHRGGYQEALKYSQKLLAKYYLDIDAHQVAFLANRELHVEEEAEFHYRIAHGLIQAIFQTGDGKTPETAWEVLSVHEEYIILQVLGLRPGSQSLMHKGKHSYDELEPVDLKTGQKVILYFNIDKPMEHLNKLFSK
jgi:hypothetical protein